MQRLLEIMLGLERGFLSREGELSVSFNPAWPGQPYVGAAVWNVLLVGLGLALVWLVYRREARSQAARVVLGTIRAMLVLMVIGLLNRPVITLGQNRVEPSVLPILLDDSLSMQVKDVGERPVARVRAASAALAETDPGVLTALRSAHEVRLYRFDSAVAPVESPAQITASGQRTDVAGAVRAVLQELQGQRVAGVVVLTDGRDVPTRNVAETLGQISAYAVKVFPVLVGSDRPATNLTIQGVSVQDSAFVGDIVNVRANVRGTGYPPGHSARVRLVDKATGQVLAGVDGTPAEQTVTLASEGAVDVELLFRPTQVGPLDVVVEAVAQPGEIDEDDNNRVAPVAVLDAKINVLYVDGMPRWEYRYLKNEMIRDRSVDISCLLTSADPTFRQEGDRPITRFPESLNELLDYDVILIGDVDPRQFSDFQLQLIAEFVSKLGGGLGMVAGPAFSPQAYRGTALEPLLPVNISKVAPEPGGATLTQGFRPVLTRQGADSSIFRFFGDRAANEKYLAEDLLPIFWYCRGVTAKSGVGEVYAEHPTDTAPDGRRTPLLVLGRFGAGRTLFSGIDDSWRWRYYTGETIFDTYWVQQLRYLARGRKLGQREAAFTSVRPVYELGEQVRLYLRILNPQLLPQLSEQLRVDVIEESSRGDGRPPELVGQAWLQRQDNQPDLYAASLPAERIGHFVARVGPLPGGVEHLVASFQTRVPRLELDQPQIDRAAMNRLAAQTGGQVLELADIARLPGLIPSAAKVVPIETARPLWDAPLILVAFVLLITLEWTLRKLFGMV